MVSPFGVVDLSQRETPKRSRRSPRGPANDAVGAAHRSGIARPKVGLSGCGCPIGAGRTRGRLLAPERRASLEARCRRVPRSSPSGSPSSERAARVRAERRGRDSRRPPTCGRESRCSNMHASRRPAPRHLVLVGAAAAVSALALGIGLADVRLGDIRRALPGRSRAHRSGTGRQGRGDTNRDNFRLAHRAALGGASRGLHTGAFTRRGCAIAQVCSSRSGRSTHGRRVTLWAGVSPKEFPTLTVTRERAGGAQASSGQKVLVGTAVGDSR